MAKIKMESMFKWIVPFFLPKPPSLAVLGLNQRRT
ncbi:hypothetical protein [Intestinimonas massiliensis (ex Afouda et al. 2020)]